MKPGELYVLSDKGLKSLDWIDPETGQIIFTNRLPSLRMVNGSKEIPKLPIMFLKMEHMGNGYCALSFLFSDRILQTVLLKESEYGVYFEKAA